jgi:hypothetical protein
VRTELVAATLAALLAQSAAPAAADWLQMRDGSRVETKGAWQQRGGQIVFTLPNGTLASVRAADVDVEASARITQEAVAPPAKPEPAARREPVLVLTDEDLPRQAVSPAEAAQTEGTAPGATAPAPAGAASESTASTSTDLEVVSWSSRYDADDNTTTLSGTVRNASSHLVHQVKVTVSAFGSDGGLLFRTETVPSPAGFPPQGSGTFAVTVPGPVTVDRAEFATSGEKILLRRPTEADRAPAPAQPAPPAAPTPTPTLLEVNWQQAPAGGAGATFTGELINPTATTASEIRLEARLHGPDGQVIASTPALLASTTLTPGQRTTFRVTFLGLHEFSKITFQPRYRPR